MRFLEFSWIAIQDIIDYLRLPYERTFAIIILKITVERLGITYNSSLK